jgi:hypothetical protein
MNDLDTDRAPTKFPINLNYFPMQIFFKTTRYNIQSMPSDGLKVCSFNAKCDQIDYKCCVKDLCLEKKCIDRCDVPDSLLAALIAVAILPSKADIYNIQNVKNKCVVEHLLKEIARVKEIMDDYVDDACDPCANPCGVNSHGYNPYLMQFACKLNEMPGLCEDGECVKEALAECKFTGINYVDIDKLLSKYDPDCYSEKAQVLATSVKKYVGTSEYNAYFSGSCLTLVKKSLCIVPETYEIPCVDSLVLFFEFNRKRFINVNLNLGYLTNSFDDLGSKRDKLENVICFLKKYKDCGPVIMTGAFGDFDYDVPQLLFRGDALIPEFAQKATSRLVKSNPVPSDFPCDLCDPIYEVLEFLFKSCKGEHVPYSWLLQYLRLKNCKRCNLYKLLPKSDKKRKCEPGCKKECCKVIPNLQDCVKCPETPDFYVDCGKNRAVLRQLKKRSDKVTKRHDQKHESKHDSKHEHKKEERLSGGCCKDDDKKSRKFDKCDKPACVSAKRCCCEPKCEKKCRKCQVEVKHCVCDDSKCEIRCKSPFVCKCDNSKHKVKVDTCRDLCKSCDKKPCCDSCATGDKCEGDCPKDSCDGVKFCDPLSVLKRELCLYNSLDKVKNVNDRFTGYHNHFNRCLDCKYPRGMFQAWAMCEDYEKPRKPSRVIDSNSELLVLDHFLVSDCLRNNISYACLSDISIEKCGKDVKELIACATDPVNGDGRFNANLTNPYTASGPHHGPPSDGNYVFQYAGSVVRSFFTHRVYCVLFDFPHVKKGCEVDCGETLHGLGLTSLWGALCSAGCDNVDISVFEKFGIDKHPYFKSFFWENYKQHQCVFDSTSFSDLILEAYGSCIDNSILRIQKRCAISEEEFYKHLLCVLSNEDSRDRFILTIGLIETVYKLDKIRDLLRDDPCLEYLDDKTTVSALLYLFSQCLTDNLKLVEALKSIRDFGKCSTSCLFNCVFGLALNCVPETVDFCVPKRSVLGLLKLLSKFLKDNCVFMEVLCRNALRIVELTAGVTGCNTSGKSTSDLVNYVEKVVGCDAAGDFEHFLNSVSCTGDYSGLCKFAKSLCADGVLLLLAICGYANCATVSKEICVG